MMNKVKVKTACEAETVELGRKLGEKARANDVIALYAPLASGKTYFTKGIALGLGITENIISPTFTIVREYVGRLNLFHIDAYRLSGCDDFLDLGGEEMLYAGGLCVIEWAEIVEEILPENTIRIKISVQPDGSRFFEFLGINKIGLE